MERLATPTFPAHLLFWAFCWAVLGIALFVVLLRSKGPKGPPAAAFDSRILLLGCFFVFLSLVLLETNPELFSSLSRESHTIEDLSFLAWAAALTFSFGTWFVHRKEKLRGGWLPILYGIAFFLCGMEEVSWFQKHIGFTTPGLFDGNKQHEVNLHNFAVRTFQTLFFAGTAFFFLAVPLLRDFCSVESRFGPYLRWLPQREELNWSVLFVAMNYRSWSDRTATLVFFLALASFVAYAWWADTRKERALYAFFAAAVVLTESYLAGRGYRQVRPHDIVEHKELWAAICYAAFSCRLFLRNRRVF